MAARRGYMGFSAPIQDEYINIPPSSSTRSGTHYDSGSSIPKLESWSGLIKKIDGEVTVQVLNNSESVKLDVDGDYHGESNVPVQLFSVPRADGLVFGITGEGSFLWSGAINDDKGDEEIQTNILISQVSLRSDASIAKRMRRQRNNGSRLSEVFKSLDVDGDGRITEADFCEAIARDAMDNKVKLTSEMIETLVRSIMDQADVGGRGWLEIEELEAFLYTLKGSGGGSKKWLNFLHSSQFGTSKDVDPIMGMSDKPNLREWTAGLLYSKAFRQEVRFYLENNWRQAFVILLWLAACTGLFVWRFQVWMHHPLYKLAGFWLPFSKGSAELIKFNMALLLFVVCKSTMTYLRDTFLGRLIPFDDRLDFHKLLAGAVVVASFTHSLGFFVGTYPGIAHASDSDATEVFGSPPHLSYLDLVLGTDAVTGYVLWGILLLLVVLALKATRLFFSKMGHLKALLGGFGTFWLSHLLLFPAFYILAAYHGSHVPILHIPHNNTWYYLIGPAILYLLEKVNKVLLSRTSRPLEVIDAEILPGRVLALHFSCPPFLFKSGMYIFVLVPGISNFEWHPFSITSAPSDCQLSIHIRAVGSWTNAMLEFWEKEISKQNSIDSSRASPDSRAMTSMPGRRSYPMRYQYPTVLVDGPFGAPAQDYERFKVLMLIGAGIGVTPFASVIRDVIHKAKNQSKYPRFKVEKVFFYFVTREQGSFQWFGELLNQATEDDLHGMIEMNNYLTSAYGDDDPRSFLLKAVQEAHLRKTGVDIIGDYKTKIATHFARPDWDEVFSSVASQCYATQVGVFYCGPPILQKELNKMCHKYTVDSTNGSSFTFRKENF